MPRKLQTADMLLLVTTFIWGWSFIIVKWSIETIHPLFFIFCRFLLASVVLSPFYLCRLKSNWRTCLRPGIFLGILLALAFITQTVGMKYTTASVSSFITGMNVVLVTIFACLGPKKLPPIPVLAGVIAATVGLLLITLRGKLHFQPGDTLTLACAFLYALHIVYTEKYAKNASAGALTLIQFATVTFLSGLSFLLFGGPSQLPASFTWMQWGGIFYTGLFATALAYLFQTKAQQQIPPFRTAIILALEPLFTGIFAIGLHFDPFDWRVVAGGLLIFCGMILSSWDSRGNPIENL